MSRNWWSIGRSAKASRSQKKASLFGIPSRSLYQTIVFDEFSLKGDDESLDAAKTHFEVDRWHFLPLCCNPWSLEFEKKSSRSHGLWPEFRFVVSILIFYGASPHKSRHLLVNIYLSNRLVIDQAISRLKRTMTSLSSPFRIEFVSGEVAEHAGDAKQM